MDGFVTVGTCRLKKGRAKWLNLLTHRCSGSLLTQKIPSIDGRGELDSLQRNQHS